MWIDSHCHIDKPDFNEDRRQMLDRAADAGIDAMVVVAASDTIEGVTKTVRFAESHPNCFASIGCHPHHSSSADDKWWPALKTLALESHAVVAIGETGLDYFYDKVPREKQRDVFIAQINLANELKLPLVCHIRDAHFDAFDIFASLPVPQLIIHCFTGTSDDAEKYLELGAYISFSGIVTFKNSHELRKAAAMVPTAKLLLETDCPYLAPIPKRGKRNEPSFLPHTAEVIAKERGMSIEALAASSKEATIRAFGLPR